VARIPHDQSEPETSWLSVSGDESFGFLVRPHADEDSQSPYDDWAHSLEDALSYGDSHRVSREDWHEPEHPWANAPPPVDFKGVNEPSPDPQPRSPTRRIVSAE
jgi:hypothetical protein